MTHSFLRAHTHSIDVEETLIPMHDETLTRLEAMLVSLRDQLDSLTDRVEGSLAEQNLAISRLRIDLARITSGAVSARAHSSQQRESVER